MKFERLRLETRLDHQATEDAMPVMAASLTKDEYVALLQSLYSLVRGWETWMETHVPDDLTALVEGRQRAYLIEQDLCALGASPRPEVVHFPAEQIPGLRAPEPTFHASFLGAMYVMEGSTLGGQYIAKHIGKRFGCSFGPCNAYFRGYGEKTGAMWECFKDRITALPNEEENVAIAAAKAMFSVFRASMSP